MKYSRVTGLALQQRRPAHVRFGSSATETVEATHAACPVCPQSGQIEDRVVSPLSANRVLTRRSKKHGYSITSSARERIECGTVSPSALAVLRLMTS